MADVLTKKQRSFNMSQISSKNTSPEVTVRSILHGMGFRYALHRKDLPGQPDIVLVKHKKIIFVHGCFWHMHRCRYGQVSPATHAKFWHDKRSGNVARDRCNLKKLRRSGWKVLVVWECQIRDLTKLRSRLFNFLSPKK